MKKLLNVIQDAVDAKRVLKTGYVRGFGGISANSCDTIGSHGYAVGWIAYCMAYQLSDEFDLSVGKILEIVMVHDQGESRSGDTGASSVAVFGTCKLHALERDGLAACVAGLACSDRAMALFDEYRAASSPEALVVRLADNLEGLEKGLQHGHNKPWIVEDTLMPILAYNVALFARREGNLRDIGLRLAEMLISTAADLLSSYGIATSEDELAKRIFLLVPDAE